MKLQSMASAVTAATNRYGVNLRMPGESADRAPFGVRVGLALVLFVVGCAKSPGDLARQHRERASQLMSSGLYTEASIEYQAAIQKWPDDVASHLGFARTLEVLGEYRQYRKTLEKMHKKFPSDPDVCLAMGRLHYSSGRYDQAASLAESALATDESFLPARILLANAFSMLGRIEEARDIWQAIVSRRGAGARDYLGAAEFEIQFGNDDHAKETLERGLQEFSGSVLLRLAKASVLMRTRDTGGAEKELRALLETAPDDPTVHASWAKFLFWTEDSSGAEQALQSARRQFAAQGNKASELALQMSRVYTWAGLLHRAKEVLEAESERSPGQPQISAELADILISLGKTVQARSLLSDAARSDAGGRRASLLAARIHLQDGHPDRALGVLGRLIAAGDLGLDAHYLYARALTETGKYAMARAEYFLILRRDPKHHFARMDYVNLLLALQDHEGALDEIESLPTPVATLPTMQHLKVVALIGAGKVSEAEKFLSESLKTSPRDPKFLKSMGDLAREKKKYELARKYYQKAMDAAPARPEPVFAEASLLYRSSGSHQEAIEVIDKYQERQGERVDALNYKASIYLSEGRLFNALQEVDRSLMIEPNAWGSRYLKAMIHLAEGEQSKARVELEQAIDLAPSRSLPYNALAGMYLKAGDVQLAEETYERLLENNPGDPLTANNLANLYLEQGKVDEAIVLANKARLGSPKDANIADTLGWALERAGKPLAAEKYLKYAADKLQSNPEVQFHWAVNLESRGNTDEAIRIFKQISSVGGENEISKRALERLKALTK